MLRAMTKPALTTFISINAINFYFNAKLTNFKWFHIDLTVFANILLNV